MEGVRVTFLPEGCAATVEPPCTLLEAAQKAGAGLAADCGGAGNCGRCRVLPEIGAILSPPTLTEEQLLSAADLAAGIRLACQARVLGPAAVVIPEESCAATQRLQVEGQDRAGVFDPPTTIRDLDISPSALLSSAADWETLTGGASGKTPDCRRLEVLRRLNRMVADGRLRVRAGFRQGEPCWLLPAGRRPLGLAVDLGTTKVAAYLMDMETGKVLASGGMMNPQIAFGEDVMTRITATMEQPGLLDEMRRRILDAVGRLAATLCQAEAAADTPDGPPTPADITECVLVGNTVMQHLALGLDVQGLGLAPFRPVIRAPVEVKAGDLGLEVHPEANVYFPPNVSGFIGSDHLAMLLASGAAREQGVILGIDIGTNSEISLNVDGALLSCSASSGPAFEGASIRFGMRAAEGAIEQVRVRDGRIAYRTVGGGRPVGLCGSGILDAVAQLRAAGAINRHGAFDARSPLVQLGPNGPEVVIVPADASRHGRELSISRRDVGRIQLAKAAIRTGIELLLRQAGVAAESVTEFVVAGAFGAYLDLESAMAIGMFPRIPRERFRQVGNAAGMGARMLLASAAAREQVRALAASLRHCELTARPEFRTQFIRALWL